MQKNHSTHMKDYVVHTCQGLVDYKIKHRNNPASTKTKSPKLKQVSESEPSSSKSWTLWRKKM